MVHLFDFALLCRREKDAPMLKRSPVTKSVKRVKAERAFAQLPAETQERILAFVYALMFRGADRPDELGEIRKVAGKGIK